MKDTLLIIQTSYLNMEPTFFGLNKQIIVYYSHFLVVVAVTVLFSWSISRILTICVLVLNCLLLSTRKELMFVGVDMIMLAVVIQINLNVKVEKFKKKVG